MPMKPPRYTRPETVAVQYKPPKTADVIHKFYMSVKWKRLRTMILAREPLCRECGKDNILTPATVVDHIQPIAKAPELSLVSSNLQPLCERHHNTKRATTDKQKS